MDERGSDLNTSRVGSVTRDMEMAKMRDTANEKMLQAANHGQASREMTVAEFLDRRIWEYETKIRVIRELRENFSISFLSLGCSRFQYLLKE